MLYKVTHCTGRVLANTMYAYCVCMHVRTINTSSLKKIGPDVLYVYICMYVGHILHVLRFRLSWIKILDSLKSQYIPTLLAHVQSLYHISWLSHNITTHFPVVHSRCYIKSPTAQDAFRPIPCMHIVYVCMNHQQTNEYRHRCYVCTCTCTCMQAPF